MISRVCKRLALLALALGILGIVVWQIAIHVVTLDMNRLLPSEVSSLEIRDAHGTLLRQEMNRAGYRETWVKLKEISPHLVSATLASEDHQFRTHHGVDWWALIRATWLNIGARRFAFGGSTLTMQLVRLIEEIPRSLAGKAYQMTLAAHLELKLDKDQILEHYLNRIYYGNGSWGAEQAALLYFGKSAAELSVGESATLAVLPRGPSYYNPFKHWERVMKRRAQILALMKQRGYITASQYDLARRVPLRLQPSTRHFKAPHFVQFVKEQLPEDFTRGTRVRTTLDWPLQERVEVAVRRHIDELYWRNLTQAAVVVIRNTDGAVLAMVGSKDYSDYRHHGAFNGVTAHLRPGSTLKPFVYGAAIEQGDSPATIALDIILPHEVNEFYTKDVRRHGFARYREALAGSYNLSAVHTLQRVGIFAVLHKLRTSGIWTLDEPDEHYDWGLSIGHARVRLLELTAAFSAFARGGRAIKPRVIHQATRVDGVQLTPTPHEYPSIFSPEVAYLIFDILSDPDARRPMFGDSVPLNLPFKIALKTGTTKAFTDLWALGATQEYTVGVWAGNFRGEPTARVKSVRGATPLLRAVYTAIANRFGDPTSPPRPEQIVNAPVCPLSGKARGPHCPHSLSELFISDQTPTETCDWHQLVCDEVTVVYPEELKSWARAALSTPARTCRESNSSLKQLRIIQPVEGARFVLEAHRPASAQRPPTRVTPASADVVWTVNGTPISSWTPTPGEHTVKVTLGVLSDEVRITYIE